MCDVDNVVGDLGVGVVGGLGVVIVGIGMYD